MIRVRMLPTAEVDPLAVASHAALKCYQAESPELGKVIKVKDRLFDVGHHTTMQHTFFTADVEGIAIGDITAGLHLVSPFYNSDQRSGRYCATLFSNPDFKQIEDYIRTFWPSVGESELEQIMDYIYLGVQIYSSNMNRATEITREFLKKERPFASEKSLDANAPKIAQEQMRMFISAIFPTGLDFTVNTTALAAMYLSAWTPAMKNLTGQMARLVMDQFPQLSFAFDPEKRRADEWGFDLNSNHDHIFTSPTLLVKKIGKDKRFVMPKLEHMHPVDLLHFMPEYMPNSVEEIETEVEVSFATMGQDQRHRTIRRGKPSFNGYFYLPAVPSECGLQEDAKKILARWKSFYFRIPKSLFTVMAPYGAMVGYTKVGSYNAIAHEQIKRLCWCAQEEISEVGRLMRLDIQNRFDGDSKLLKIFQPPCYETGKCVEGARYCGRDLRERTPETYFLKRKV